MSLRIAFLTNYPLVDNVDWKKEFVIKSLENNYVVDVFYGKSDFVSLFKNFLKKRKYTNDVSKRATNKKQKNKIFFKRKNLKIYNYKNLNSAKSILKLKNGNYDILVTALDQILSKKLINTVNTKIINVHYGLLPDIKGTSATEWTYLKTQKCVITLHYIDVGIDTGNIISKHNIDISNTRNFNEIRLLIQNEIPNILINFLKIYPNAKVLNENNKKGKLYTFMHTDIKKLLKHD